MKSRVLGKIHCLKSQGSDVAQRPLSPCKCGLPNQQWTNTRYQLCSGSSFLQHSVMWALPVEEAAILSEDGLGIFYGTVWTGNAKPFRQVSCHSRGKVTLSVPTSPSWSPMSDKVQAWSEVLKLFIVQELVYELLTLVRTLGSRGQGSESKCLWVEWKSKVFVRVLLASHLHGCWN